MGILTEDGVDVSDQDVGEREGHGAGGDDSVADRAVEHRALERHITLCFELDRSERDESGRRGFDEQVRSVDRGVLDVDLALVLLHHEALGAHACADE